MYAGFPLRLVPLVRCQNDGQALALVTDGSSIEDDSIVTGTVECTVCPQSYHITQGILDLFASADERKEGIDTEHRLWEEAAEDYERLVVEGRGAFTDVEIAELLQAIAPCRGAVLLELGCGTGRVTTHVVDACSALIAVDFSLCGLRLLAAKLSPNAPIGLVRADITHFAPAPGRFDLALASQLMTNLRSREQRLAMFRVASNALTDRGRFIFSNWYHGVRNRLAGVAQAGRYTEGGLYRCYSTRKSIAREAAPYFGHVQIARSVVLLPLATRLGLPVVPLARWAARAPLVNELARMLVCSAERPIREPIEGPPSIALVSLLDLVRQQLSRK